MVQSWENFMDPSGGYRRNDYIDGTAAIAVPLIGEGFLIPMVLHRSEKMALRQSALTAKNIATRNYQRAFFEKVAKHSSLNTVPSFSTNISYGPSPGRASSSLGMGFTRDLREQYKKDFAKWNAGKGAINKRYATLRRGIRGIGFGYLALLGVELGASILAPSPGVTSQALQNDAASMGYGKILDSSQAYTQRQRALMAIHDSQLGIRNVIGSEAPHLHR